MLKKSRMYFLGFLIIGIVMTAYFFWQGKLSTILEDSSAVVTMSPQPIPVLPDNSAEQTESIPTPPSPNKVNVVEKRPVIHTEYGDFTDIFLGEVLGADASDRSKYTVRIEQNSGGQTKVGERVVIKNMMKMNFKSNYRYLFFTNFDTNSDAYLVTFIRGGYTPTGDQ